MNTPRTLAQNNNSSAFLLACYGYLLPKKDLNEIFPLIYSL